MESIKVEHIEFLERNKSLYEMIKKAGFCRNYTKEIFNELSLIHHEYIGKHNLNHWCSECRIQLVRHIYQWYESITEKNYSEAMEVFSSLDNPESDLSIPEKKKRGRKKKLIN